MVLLSTPRKPPLILIVDDDIHMVTLLRTTLLQEGYTVKTATDAQSAKQIAWQQRPNLIVSDIMMPVIDGIAMMEAINSLPGMQKIPVIFISGKATDNFESKTSGEAIGYALLRKPFDLPQFLQLVKRFIH